MNKVYLRLNVTAVSDEQSIPSYTTCHCLFQFHVTRNKYSLFNKNLSKHTVINTTHLYNTASNTAAINSATQENNPDCVFYQNQRESLHDRLMSIFAILQLSSYDLCNKK